MDKAPTPPHIVLGIPKNADIDTARAAWKRMAKAHHPDTASSQQDKQKAHETLTRLNTAWEHFKRQKPKTAKPDTTTGTNLHPLIFYPHIFERQFIGSLKAMAVLKHDAHIGQQARKRLDTSWNKWWPSFLKPGHETRHPPTVLFPHKATVSNRQHILFHIALPSESILQHLKEPEDTDCQCLHPQQIHIALPQILLTHQGHTPSLSYRFDSGPTPFLMPKPLSFPHKTLISLTDAQAHACGATSADIVITPHTDPAIAHTHLLVLKPRTTGPETGLYQKPEL